MEIFFTLFLKIIPLYLIIALGFLAQKKLQVNRDPIARLLIYIIAPAVVFLGTYQAKLDFGMILLPFLTFFIGAFLLGITLFFGRFIWKDGTERIAAFSAGTGNTGYFGIPVCLALIGEESLPVVVMATFGLIFLENTLGFYVVARSSHTAKQALKKVLTLPSFYAFLLGLSLNIFQINLHSSFLDFFTAIKGAYPVLGMMIIGLGLAGMTMGHFDWKFTAVTFINKFLFWPVIILLIIYFDQKNFQFFNELIYKVLIIESLVPLAANTVAYASELKAHPEKAALVVFASTAFALIYIPSMILFLDIA